MLTGKAKTDYQREYMRRRRSNKPAAPVRPKGLKPIEATQSYNPMMVGYVPPERT